MKMRRAKILLCVALLLAFSLVLMDHDKVLIVPEVFGFACVLFYLLMEIEKK